MSKLKWLDRRVSMPGPYLCLCLTEKAYKKAMRHCKVKNPPAWLTGSATTHTIEKPGAKDVTCIVAMNADGFNDVEIYGLLVHEAVHVWQQFAVSIGEASPASEQEAYAIQGISQELIADYIRQKGSGK